MTAMRRHAPGGAGGRAPGPAPGHGPSNGRRLKAVIADDEPRARQFLARLLAEHQEIELVGEA